jgi:hypothetical protein
MGHELRAGPQAGRYRPLTGRQHLVNGSMHAIPVPVSAIVSNDDKYAQGPGAAEDRDGIRVYTYRTRHSSTSTWPSRRRPSTPRLPTARRQGSFVGGAPDTQACHRPRVEAFRRDGLGTLLAPSVDAGPQPLQCRVDVIKPYPCLDEQGRGLSPLESDRLTFGVMFVVGCHARGRRNDLPDRAGQGLDLFDRARAIPLESGIRS